MDDDFEHHLDNHTLKFIRFKARQLAGKYGFRPDEREDIEQSLILDCLQRLRRFDPGRGSRQSFGCGVVGHAVATLIEARRARHRGYGVPHVSLDASHDFEGADAYFLISEDQYRARMGLHSSPLEQILAIEIDVNLAVAALPCDLARICRLLMDLESTTQVAVVIGISRATLHRRIQAIRQAFLLYALFRYISGPVDTSSRVTR